MACVAQGLIIEGLESKNQRKYVIFLKEYLKHLHICIVSCWMKN